MASYEAEQEPVYATSKKFVLHTAKTEVWCKKF
jgi:hypothetical protein